MNVTKETIQIKKHISEEEAMSLLFSNQEDYDDLSCFDEYGNYIFPTDYVATTPNLAFGSSESFDYSSIFQS